MDQEGRLVLAALFLTVKIWDTTHYENLRLRPFLACPRDRFVSTSESHRISACCPEASGTTLVDRHTMAIGGSFRNWSGRSHTSNAHVPGHREGKRQRILQPL